ncbi:DEAD/DEAH box helicase family protein [Facklamia sp. 7083-14-GEN3]|uniref:DEAD/DEAH box helicase family protein n=1 Tax=Facklamia sp. 7083-14-GEN3 TaxID=2973478 RepID=UPI00215B7CFD|nr:DEAD/DEAH box helicase family protein [Facklamia sp. 7083-14-GEN3]MCR8969283.1 DEAD/DEAH box helicase family protein [Facklamia sp. 7083-14-GEN3]
MSVITKLGRQTPTVSYYFEFDKSDFEEAVKYYERTSLKVYEWQKNLLKPLMAVDDDGLWTHQKFGYSLPRRNGKTEVVYIKELWALEKGLNILHTAHRISTAHSSYEKVKKYLEMFGYVEGEDFNSIKAKGQERLELYNSGGVIQFRTRTSTGGLGEGFDLLVIDEAQEYTDDQESALKYTVTDSDNPQTIMLGTPPTPVSSGTVFTKYRQTTLDGGNKYSGWAEWSVPDMKDIRDVDAWYETNPSMGYHLNERKIEAELGDDELDHNVQRLGYWPKYNQKSAITTEEWEDMEVKRIPRLASKLYVGIKYGQNGVNVALSIAVKTSTERIFIEAIDCQSVRNGNGWILDFLNRSDVEKVVIDGASGQRLLESEMKQARIKPHPILPKVSEVIVANAAFERGVNTQNIAHKNQPSLTQVVTNCEKRPIGSSGGFGYRSQFEDHEIALMDSMILAYWACVESKPKRKQRVGY